MTAEAHDRPAWSRSFDEMIERERNLPAAERARRDDDFRRREQSRREGEERDRRITEALMVSELGPRWKDRTLADYKIPPGLRAALDAAREFVAEYGSKPRTRGFWLYGSVGVGKTHICAATLSACAEKGIPGTFKTAAGFLEAIKHTYGRDGKLKYGEADIIARLASMPLLVLDDLDKADFTQWASQKFYQLINGRYNQNVPLLATSNCAPADLALGWAERGLDRTISIAIVDRLREMCEIIEVEGSSYRGIAR
jgi:DNA replication protein DnaC